MKKDKSVQWFKDHQKCKTVVVFQNIKYFLIPSLKYEPINPTHKILVWGLKKHKYCKYKDAHYEKVAMLLKNAYPVYILAMYIVLGWLVFCKL